MELECTNPNGEIVLGIKTKLHGTFLLIVKIAFINESYKWFFSGRCSKYLKNKIVHNSLITNPNGMNQRFSDRQNIIYGKKIQKKNSNFCNFFATLSPLFWTYLGINFVPKHQLKKIIFSQSLSVFFIFKKNFKKS